MQAYVPNKEWHTVVRELLPQITQVAFCDDWDDAQFVWKPTRQGFNQYDALEVQNGLVNHLYRNHLLTTKNGLYHTLKQGGKLRLLPPTWIFKPSRHSLDEFRRSLGPGAYILKPAIGHGGQGIVVAPTKWHLPLQYGETAVVQRLIEPHLLNGHKYDIRLHVLVDTVGDVHMYDDLTITRVNKHIYDVNSARTALTNVDGGDAEAQLMDHSWLMGRATSMVVQLFNEETVRRMRSGYSCGYELFGLDIQVSKQKRVYLLEVNQNPNLAFGNSEVDEQLRKMTRDMLRHVLGHGSGAWKKMR